MGRYVVATDTEKQFRLPFALKADARFIIMMVKVKRYFPSV
jgi:hypothetical protein